jgi:hypothetical protein
MRIQPFKLAYRFWYYFRIGYATYLTFLLGYASTLITVYYLAIKNLPALLAVFPDFVPFAILATVVGGPLSVAVGWIHLKRSRLYSSELDISTEANPYNYKITPGINTEVLFPAYVEMLRVLRKFAENNALLKESELEHMEELEKKFEFLLKGGTVGTPRRTLDF